MDRCRADLKSNKPHTELLFCTLGSSSPDKNEGIIFQCLGSVVVHVLEILSGCCLVFVVIRAASLISAS